MSELQQTMHKLIDTMEKRIEEILSCVDNETAEEFLRIFNEKMKELNEQTNLQKNPGASG
jgi:hypothetical protein